MNFKFLPSFFVLSFFLGGEVVAKAENSASSPLSVTTPEGVSSPTPNTMTKDSPEKSSDVIVYTSNFCTWCKSAQELLESKNVKYRTIDVRGRKELIDEMEKVTGARTVPQIVIKGKPIGGYMSLVGMNLAGELDDLAKNSQEKFVQTQNVSNTSSN